MKDIFEFNHIDESLSELDITTVKDIYSHYHKKYWCFKRSYKSYKFLDDVFTISGISLVAIGTISGGIIPKPCSSRSYKWCWDYSCWYWKEKESQEKN